MNKNKRKEKSLAYVKRTNAKIEITAARVKPNVVLS